MAENVRSSSSSSSRKARNNTISSILLSSSPTNDKPTTSSSMKNNNFTSATFRGLGCKASSSSSQVSLPSANKKLSKRKNKLKTKKTSTNEVDSANPSSSCVGVPDVCCAPRITLATDAASVDCRLVSRRPARGKLDAVHSERPYSVRRMVSPEDVPFLEFDTALGMSGRRSDGYGSRHHRHVRHGFQDGLAEIVMLQRGRSDGLDRYRDLRFDVDNMSYEELVELGEKIGHVSTGLREDEIACCLRSSKLATWDNFSSHFVSETERKCSICQEEYEAGEEMGKLDCGHFYHIDCIKQWLGQKNICPICKTAAVSQI